MSKNMENVKPISLFASLVRFISFFPSRFLCYREVGGGGGGKALGTRLGYLEHNETNEYIYNLLTPQLSIQPHWHCIYYCW